MAEVVQTHRYASPWTSKTRLKILLWHFAWPLLCAWTPKPFNKWRLFWLRLFGARLYGRPFVHQSARIQMPWHLIMHDHSCLGDGAVAYTLGEIELMEGCTIAQEAYLCTGTHDFDKPTLPLTTEKIFVGKNAFIGARAFLMPGVIIGENSIVGACSVVTRSVAPHTSVAGNPAVLLNDKGVAL